MREELVRFAQGGVQAGIVGDTKHWPMSLLNETISSGSRHADQLPVGPLFSTGESNSDRGTAEAYDGGDVSHCEPDARTLDC